MRAIAVLTAILALAAQPVLAQSQAKSSGQVVSKVQDDEARTAEARRLTAEALAADQTIVDRNAAARSQYNAARSDYDAGLAANKAAQDKYQAELAAQQAAAAQYQRDRAAWEARVKACRSGDTSQCGGN
jgi:hypothetical protein